MDTQTYILSQSIFQWDFQEPGPNGVGICTYTHNYVDMSVKLFCVEHDVVHRAEDVVVGAVDEHKQLYNSPLLLVFENDNISKLLALYFKMPL